AVLLYYEALLLRETLIVTGSLALVYSGLRAFERGSRRAWLVFGLVGGVTMLVKSTMLPLIAVAACAAWWRARREPRVALRRAGALAVGVLLGLAPALVRNRVVGAPTFSLGAVGPVTFASSNTVDYVPEVGF